MLPIEPGTVSLGKDGPMIFDKGRSIVPHSHQAAPIFKGSLQGNWTSETIDARNGVATKIGATLPAGASIATTFLYAVVSGAGSHGQPHLPTVIVDGEQFSGSKWKVAAKLPPGSDTSRAAYRVNILAPAAAKDITAGGRVEFDVSGTPADGTKIEEYQLVVVYQHDAEPLRSITLADGHLEGP